MKSLNLQLKCRAYSSEAIWFTSSWRESPSLLKCGLPNSCNKTPMQSLVSFELYPNAGTPVFQQLIDQVKRLLSCGQLVENDLLPSTRDVARQLVINPMTVSKAYKQLEMEGYLIRKKGVGMLVKIPNDPAKLDSTILIKPVIQDLIKQATQLGLKMPDIKKLLAEEWRKVNE
jgi:GntR family transcriptional regulator